MGMWMYVLWGDLCMELGLGVEVGVEDLKLFNHLRCFSFFEFFGSIIHEFWC